MVRRKVYLEKIEGHIGANHLTSAEKTENTSGTEVDVFETVLLSDVFETVYATTRQQHDSVKSEPLTVLVMHSAVWDVRLLKFFCKMYSEVLHANHCLFGQHSSCSIGPMA